MVPHMPVATHRPHRRDAELQLVECYANFFPSCRLRRVVSKYDRVPIVPGGKRGTETISKSPTKVPRLARRRRLKRFSAHLVGWIPGAEWLCQFVIDDVIVVGRIEYEEVDGE